MPIRIVPKWDERPRHGQRRRSGCDQGVYFRPVSGNGIMSKITDAEEREAYRSFVVSPLRDGKRSLRCFIS